MKFEIWRFQIPSKPIELKPPQFWGDQIWSLGFYIFNFKQKFDMLAFFRIFFEIFLKIIFLKFSKKNFKRNFLEKNSKKYIFKIFLKIQKNLKIKNSLDSISSLLIKQQWLDSDSISLFTKQLGLRFKFHTQPSRIQVISIFSPNRAYRDIMFKRLSHLNLMNENFL